MYPRPWPRSRNRNKNKNTGLRSRTEYGYKSRKRFTARLVGNRDFPTSPESQSYLIPNRQLISSTIELSFFPPGLRQWHGKSLPSLTHWITGLYKLLINLRMSTEFRRIPVPRQEREQVTHAFEARSTQVGDTLVRIGNNQTSALKFLAFGGQF